MIDNFSSTYKELLTRALTTIFANLLKISNVNSKVLSDPDYAIDKSSGLDIEPKGNPKLINSSVIYAGRSILTNNTNIDQKMKTDSFMHQETFTTSSKTTHGFKLGLKASTTFKVEVLDIGFQTSLEVSTEYNFSDEKSYISTKTKTITIPSQEIIVPAHTAVEVSAFFTKGNARGKVKLSTNLDGIDDVTFISTTSDGTSSNGKGSIGFGNVLEHSGMQVPGYNYVSPYAISLVGEGEYTCEDASQFRVSITPIKNGIKNGKPTIINVEPQIKVV